MSKGPHGICPGKWIAQVFGNHRSGCEISLVKEGNEHGRKSWGWPDPDNKVILYSQEASDLSKEEFNRLVKLAKSYAEKLNS